jgi:hypothetical protein
MTVCPVFAVEFDGECGIRAESPQGSGDRDHWLISIWIRERKRGKGRPSSQLNMWVRTLLLQDPHHPVEPPPNPESAGVMNERIAVPFGARKYTEESDHQP